MMVASKRGWVELELQFANTSAARATGVRLGLGLGPGGERRGGGLRGGRAAAGIVLGDGRTVLDPDADADADAGAAADTLASGSGSGSGSPLTRTLWPALDPSLVPKQRELVPRQPQLLLQYAHHLQVGG
jgi:hypothetical protein